MELLVVMVRTPTSRIASNSCLSGSSVRHNRGFTLVELLVVFAIAALLIGLAPAAFDRMRESSQYRNTLRTLLTDLRGARYRAVHEGAETRFHIHLGERTYGVDGQPKREFPESLQIRFIVANNELSSGQDGAIRFLPEGGATGGSVDIVRPSGSGVRLRVDWLSGRVEQEPITP